MKIFASKRTAGPARGQIAFQLSPVAAGCAVFLTVLAGSAYAQETPAPAPAAAKPDVVAVDANGKPIQAVVVTGLRRGIEAAISIKKNSSSIVEAISAEDIGKLPDSSVAESMARLPGVTAQRDKSTGKASSISIRGMSPDMNGSLFNGRESASTGDSRAPDFDVFPAELLGSVLVYKTPDALLVGQGLSSTVDLRTVQPLDFGKRTIAVNYRKQKSGVGNAGLEEGRGNRFALSYVDQFADRTIGVALGFTRLDEKNNQQQKFDSWGGWAADTTYQGNSVKVPGGFKGDTETSGGTRDGAMAALQFRPSRNFRSSLDIFYSKGHNSLKRTGLEGAVLGSASGAGALGQQYDPDGVLSNATIVNGVATAGTISNFKGVIRNHINNYDDKLTNIGWNNVFKVDDWGIDVDLSQSKASKKGTRYETTAGQAGNTPANQLNAISWTGFNGSNFDQVQYKTALNLTDRGIMKLTDVEGWSGGPSSPQAGYLALPDNSDKIDNFRLTGSHDLSFGPLVATQFGINHADRLKTHISHEFRLVIKGGDPYGAAAIPGTGTALAGTTGLIVPSFDPTDSGNSIYDRVGKVDEPILNKDWTVREKVTTAFIKGDLDGNVMGLSYRGNIGTQIVRTDQHSTGFDVDKSKCTGNTAATCPGAAVGLGKSYTDFLPSMNLTMDVGNDQMLRLGLAKVLARPQMDKMKASSSFALDNGSQGTPPMLKGSGGNPNLDPFRAKAIDLSFEKYFGKKGVISIAAFYKKLDSYVLDIGRPYDFKPFVQGSTPLPPGGSTVGILTTPTNGSGGNIHGIEINADVPFSLATPMLDGFGVQLNHSDTRSSVSLPTSGFTFADTPKANIPMPGLSRKVTNLKLYYEANGFQIAVAQKKRSDFLGEITDYEDTRKLTFIKGESIVDLQVAYEFQGGPLKGVTLNVSAQNLTNAKFQRYVNDPAKPVEVVSYGKTYLFGAGYKF